MAEETPISPLDPLGPEFGGIEPPKLDAQSYEPFEGDRLVDPNPIIPDMTLPQVRTQTYGPGYPPNKPPQRRGGVKSISEIRKESAAIGEVAAARMSTKNNPNTYSQIYSYKDSPSNGDAFYKRYLELGEEEVQELGFTPFRDNEGLYAEHGSKMAQWGRMADQWGNMWADAFVSGPKSLYRGLVQGDWGSDTEAARRMEEYNSIGQINTGGWDAGTWNGIHDFIGNSTLSSAYTIGIASEILLEELAIMAATPFTAGASQAGQLNVARNVGRLFKGTKATSLSNSVRKINNAVGANKYWQASKGLRDFINPLENTMKAARSIKKADNLSDLAKISRTAGGFYRDVRNINASLAEARLEGGSTENSTYDRLYNDYWFANGEVPPDDMQADFVKQSKQAGIEAIQWNFGLIYASNKMIFPNLFRSGTGLKGIVGNKIDDIINLKDGKLFFKKAGKAGAKASYEYLSNGFRSTVKSFAKDPLRKSLVGAASYFRANIMEGFQEVGQETISSALQNYYVDSFKSQRKSQFDTGKGIADALTKGQYFNDAMTDQFSAQGFETFASGFFMGTFGKAFNAGTGALGIGYKKYLSGNKAEYNDYVEKRANYGNRAAQHLTALAANPDVFFNAKAFNFTTQAKAAQALKGEKNTMTIQDVMNDSFTQHIQTNLREGTLPVFLDHLKGFQDTSVEEFEDAFGFERGTGEQYQARIPEIVKKAERMNSRNKYMRERFQNRPRALLKNYKEGSPEYRELQILAKSWDNALDMSVILNENYDQALERMQKIEKSLVSEGPIKNMTSSQANVLLQDGIRLSEINLLKNEIEALKETETEDGRKLLKQKQESLETLEEFQQAKKEYDETLRETGDPEEVGRKQNEAKERLRGVYKKYLKNVADGGVVFNEKADDAFDKIVDYYTLDETGRKMAEAVNLLHDPEFFLEQVERNKVWMTDMYNNRAEYYEQEVQRALNANVYNTLLNTLWDNGYGLELKDVKNFMENDVDPPYFIDVQRKQIIPNGTDTYNRLMQVLYAAKTLTKDGETQNQKYSRRLQQELDVLNKQEQDELARLPRTVQESLALEINPDPNTTSFNISKIKNLTVDGDRIEAVVSQDKKLRKVTYINKEGKLFEEAELVDNEDLGYTKALVYRFKEGYESPKDAEKIMAKYETLKEEAIEKYGDIKEEVDPEIASFFSQPTAAKLKAIDSDLYQGLVEIYQKNNPEAFDFIESEDQLDNALDSFLAQEINTNSDIKNLLKDLVAEMDNVSEQVIIDSPFDRVDLFEGYFVDTESYKDFKNHEKDIKKLIDLGQKLDSENATWNVARNIAVVKGREIVEIETSTGDKFLMYKSTGEGTGVQSKGEWVPFAGFAKKGWFVKVPYDTSTGEFGPELPTTDVYNPKFNKWGSKTFEQIANALTEKGAQAEQSTVEKTMASAEKISNKFAEQFKEEKKDDTGLTANEKAFQAKNLETLGKRIDLLNQQQEIASKDITQIEDTLAYLNELLDTTVDLTKNQMKDLINKIENLDKVTADLIKSNQNKRAEKVGERIPELRSQIRTEFTTANDILDRINELKEESEQLEIIKEDLKKQADYYKNLVKDPSMKTFGTAEIESKIKKVESKISTIEKLIRTIKNAISKSIAYLKEYVGIWNNTDKAYRSVKQKAGLNAPTIIDSKTGLTKINPESEISVPETRAELKKLESEVLQSMEDVETLEGAKEIEDKRLNQLQKVLRKYDDQLRYLNDLLVPVKKDKISDKVKSENLKEKINKSKPKVSVTKEASKKIEKKKEKIKEKIKEVFKPQQRRTDVKEPNITSVTLANNVTLSDLNINQLKQVENQLVKKIENAKKAEEKSGADTNRSAFLENDLNRLREYIKEVQTPAEVKTAPVKTKSKGTTQQVKDIALTPEFKETIRQIQANKNFVKLDKNGEFYINEKTNKKLKRVSNIISVKPEDSKLLKSAQTIGTKVDELVRDFFAGNLKQNLADYKLTDNVQVVEDFLKQLEDTTLYKKIKEGSEVMLANDIVVYNDDLGVAGTVDLLTYDKDGNVRIYDMKTMRGDNFTEKYRGDAKNKYESTKFGKSKKQKHTEQLSMYRILLNNTHGLRANSLGVMPISIMYNEGDTQTSQLQLMKGQSFAPVAIRQAKLTDPRKIDSLVRERQDLTGKDLKEINQFKNDIVKANAERLDELELELAMDADVSLAGLEALQELINQRREDLSSASVYDIADAPPVIGKPGMKFAVVNQTRINPADNKSTMLEKNDVVTWVKSDAKSITLRKDENGKSTEYNVNFDEIKNYINVEELNEANAQEVEVKVKPAEIDNSNNNQEDIQSMISDPKQMAKIAEEGKGKTAAEIAAELFNEDSDCK